jgi:hypothetical protein
MSKRLKDFPLGATAKDVITGFEGIIGSRVEYLAGCDQIGIKPTRLNKDGEPIKEIWFDITRIRVLGAASPEIQKIVDGKLQDNDGEDTEPPGGPQETPVKSH